MTVSPDPQLGSELAGYRVEELLGRGGMGTVYRAEDLRLKRKVALKLVAPELSEDERFRERFLAESELAASLEHPNVIPIHDAGQVDDQLYLVMRLVEGSDLRTLLAAEGPLDPARALAICAQLASALDAAHARGLVHRDVKPSNVLLDANEHVYLADFGLARELADTAPITGDGRSVGTPAYVAPEQIRGDDPGAAADQYALACVLYECLTGETPFPRERELAVLFAHLDEEPPRASGRNPQLPDAIDLVLTRALAKDPAERYPTGAELITAAGSALGLASARGWSRRQLALAALALAVLAATSTFGITRVVGGGDAASRTPVADSVVRLDPDSGEIRAVVPIGRQPTSVTLGDDALWVVNSDDGTVTQLSPDTGSLRRTLRVSGLIPDDATSTIAADDRRAWVVTSSGGNGFLTELDEGSSAFPPQIPLGISDPTAVAVGAGAVWVAGKDVGRNVIVKVDPRRRAVVGSVEVAVGENLTDIAVGEGRVWFTDFGREETLWRLDPATMRVTGHVHTTGDDSIAVGGGAVWLGDIETGTLTRVDPATMRVVSKTQLFRPPFLTSVDVAFGAGAVWLSHLKGRQVLRIEPTSSRVTARIPIAPRIVGGETFPAGPRGVTAGEGDVWVAVGRPT